MKVMQVIKSGQGPTLSAADVAQPKPGRGQILVRVYAAGVTTTELHWDPTTHKKSGEPRLNAIPGHEFSGVIAGIGDGADGFILVKAFVNAVVPLTDAATAYAGKVQKKRGYGKVVVAIGPNQ
jgi:NADPH:quinone reductase-like Zn-dependent oxidoreductase